MKQIRTGIFSGSFNPVHKGHIALAEHVLAAGAVEEVWFIRSPQNPFKARTELMDDALRARLLQRAIEGHPGLRLCDVEDRLPRPSYTVDTLNALRTEHPDREFHLMIGADNWAVFDKWRQWETILRDFRLLVYPRPGYPLTEALSAQDIEPQYAAQLLQHVRFLLEAPLFDISATEIREALRGGDEAFLRQWLPVGVVELLTSDCAAGKCPNK